MKNLFSNGLYGLRSMSLPLGVFLLTLLQCICPEQASGQNASAAPQELNVNAEDVSDSRYRIGPGDVLDIRVFKAAQLSREAVRVDMRGLIQMPLIEGDIQAACKTENELAQALATAYAKYQRHPHIDVFVKEYNSTPVAVMGAVGKPGQFQIQRPTRVLELLTLAGGVSDRAGARVLVAHGGPVGSCAAGAGEDAENFQMFNLNDTIHSTGNSNPFVQPGDVITVPEAQQVFVVGNVYRPTTISLKEPVTLSMAIAMAGGTLPDTKIDRIHIIRQAAGTQSKTDITVDLKSINKQEKADVMLQPNDIIDVPTSSGRRALRGIMNSIIPTAARLPYLAVP